MKRRLERWRRYRRLVRELEQYSQRDLAELGIARADIHRVAADAATG